MTSIVHPNIQQNLPQLAHTFQSAAPFKHVLMTPFFTEDFLQRVIEAFPKPDPASMVNEFGAASSKHTVETLKDLGGVFAQWDMVLQSENFIRLIEGISGIPALVADPDHIGAGTHNNLHGQSLDLHIDFNRHPKTRYHRRLNLIIYLNEPWDNAWGGALELHKDAWNRRERSQFVAYPPLANHAVMFETTEHSWHGFQAINLPEALRHHSRKSLTVYYYTRHLDDHLIAKEHSTVYVPSWIPESVQPGQTLSEEAYSELVQLMERRDHFLQGLYTKHHELMQRHRGLERMFRILRPVTSALKALGLTKVIKKLFRLT